MKKLSKRGGRNLYIPGSSNSSALQELADPNEPNLAALIEEFNWAFNQRTNNLFSRQRLNYETRNCVWANQSEDGRKWTPRAGEAEVFPWAGASDVRVPLVDKYVNEDVAKLMVVWRRMRTTVSATEINDAGWAARMTNFLRWMKYTQMSESTTEARLLANYYLERGVAVMSVTWDKRNQLGYEEIDLETVMSYAQQSQDPRIQELHNMIMDPEFDDESAQIGQMLYPDVPLSRLKKVVRDLRQDGTARFPRPYEIVNRPRFMALAPNDDVFLPPEVTSLETARSIFRRELLSEAQLRDRVKSHGWDEAWVEEMITSQRGIVTHGDDITTRTRRIQGSVNANNTRKLFEVLHGFRRLADAEGVPGIFYTVFNTRMPEVAGLHELLDYDHGQLPFVLLEREKRSRLIDDSRGYGEIASTWQSQVKADWDQRTDRGSIATLPPSYYPDGQAPDKWGPGVQVPTMRPEAYGFMEIPKFDAGSREVAEDVRRFADEYFGRPVNEENMTQSQTMQQDLADNWMSGWAEIDTQVLQLCQQYQADSFYFRVVGSSKGKPVHATREDIQGKFDLAVNFNMKHLDPEFVETEISLIEKLLQMDVNGIIDRDEALVVTGELIDPNLAERLLKPGENASQHEIEDEQNVFVRLLAGIPVDVKPGQAYQLRLNVLKQLFQTNEEARQKYQQNPQVKDAFERRGKQLTFQLQQQQNAVTGRLGTAPAGQPENLMGGGGGPQSAGQPGGAGGMPMQPMQAPGQ